MPKSGLIVVKDNYKAMAEGLRLLSDLRVMVGVPEDKSQRRDGDAISNAALLYVHENGAPEVGIPARPTLKPGVRDARVEIERRLKLAGQAALEGRPSSVRNQFAAAGQAGASAVKAKINSNVGPPLAPSTLAARKRRGVKRTNTLVDTGQMRNAVTYVVREEK
jgi:hypothetical protein